jgi:hypothetical protein
MPSINDSKAALAATLEILASLAIFSIKSALVIAPPFLMLKISATHHIEYDSVTIYNLENQEKPDIF